MLGRAFHATLSGLHDSGDQRPVADHAESYCAACGRSYTEANEFCPQDGTRLVKFAARVDPMIGRVLDERFEVRARLGRGGMGTVYRAWQRSVDREVAIKVIDAKLAHDRVAAKRFLREARLASRLSQPSIVNVHDFGQAEDGVLYLVMELLRGRTLAQVAADEGALTSRRAIAIGVQLCDALEAAHALDIVHRDLKPQNVVILDDPPGRDLVKVLDFGLAKSLAGDSTVVTRTDGVLGTPLYMPPEVIQGLGADARSDLYSLGCMLYELLTGAPPFMDPSANMVFAKHLSETAAPLPASVPAPVRELVDALLAKDPDGRPASAAEVRATLLAVLQGGSDLDTAPRASPRSRAALAETLAAPVLTVAATRDAATRDVATRVAFEAPPARSRALLVVASVLVTAAAAGGSWLLLRGGAAAPALDAAATPAAAVDASPRSAPRDAAADAVALDAALAPPPPDAGSKRGGGTHRGSGRGTARGTGTGTSDPDLDFIVPGAGRGTSKR